MHRIFVALVAVLSIETATAQPAPSVNYTSLDVEAGGTVQIGYYASADKKCTPTPLPKVRMIEPPKVGTLSIKLGKLTTDKIEGCPKLEVGAQVAYYSAKANASGGDHVVYEVSYANGEVAVQDITVRIKAKAGAAEKSGI